jgi:hypothetical protein
MQPTGKEANDITVPPGSIVLHIGPHKTGTTALQLALDRARAALEAQGVSYVWEGMRQNANMAAQAVGKLSSRKFAGDTSVPYWHWDNLLKKVAERRTNRVVVSGEEFSNLPLDTIKKVIEDFGSRYTTVLVTLRPLEDILCSSWQQYIQFGAVTDPFEEWLVKVLSPDTKSSLIERFWMRNRHDTLVERWGSLVGNKNVTVIALNPSDRGLLFRSVETLTGLRQGTLVDEGRLINRSITAPEAEAIRAVYMRLQHLGLADLSRHIRYMVSSSELIKRERKPMGEAKITLPRWALERSRELSAEMVQNIVASGARIIGNVETLAPTGPIDAPEHLSPIKSVPADLPGWTAAGVIIRSGISRGDLPPTPTVTLPTAWLRRATGRQLIGEVLRRVKIRIMRPFNRSQTGDELKSR